MVFNEDIKLYSYVSIFSKHNLETIKDVAFTSVDNASLKSATSTYNPSIMWWLGEVQQLVFE